MLFKQLLCYYYYSCILFINCENLFIAPLTKILALPPQASNAYLQFLRGPGTNILFESVKEMPKPGTKLRLDLSSLLGTLFFTWVILQLFPVSISIVLHLS